MYPIESQSHYTGMTQAGGYNPDGAGGKVASLLAQEAALQKLQLISQHTTNLASKTQLHAELIVGTKANFERIRELKKSSGTTREVELIEQTILKDQGKSGALASEINSLQKALKTAQGGRLSGLQKAGLLLGAILPVAGFVFVFYEVGFMDNFFKAKKTETPVPVVPPNPSVLMRESCQAMHADAAVVEGNAYDK